MDSSSQQPGSEASSTPKGIILLEDGWQEIKTSGIDKIEALLQDKNESGSIDNLTFPREEAVEIYTKVFVMCHQVDPFCWSEDLYLLHGETVDKYLLNSIAPCINKILSERLKSLPPQQKEQPQQQQSVAAANLESNDPIHKSFHAQTETLLSEFLGQWHNFLFYNKWLTSFLRILDRVYAEPNNMPTISKVALQKFESAIFSPHKTDLTTALMDLIRLERDGATIKRSLVVETASVFKAMDGSHKTKGENESDAFIAQQLEMTDARPKQVDFLEDAFLDATRDYYASKRDKDWRFLDSYDYYAKVQQSIDEEREKSKEYLHRLSSPESALHHVLVQELHEKAPVPPPADMKQNNPSCVQYLPVVGLFAGQPTTRNTPNRKSSFNKNRETAPDPSPRQERKKGRSRSLSPNKFKSKRSSSLNRFRRSGNNGETGAAAAQPSGKSPARRRFSFGKASTAPAANSFAKQQKKMRASVAKKKEQRQQQQQQPPDSKSQSKARAAPPRRTPPRKTSSGDGSVLQELLTTNDIGEALSRISQASGDADSVDHDHVPNNKTEPIEV